jgi:hypothetical protein
MKKEDFMPVAVGVFIIILSIVFGLFINLNYNNKSRQFITEGVLISKEISTSGSIGQGGSTLGLVTHFTIKLDSGEKIGMINQPFCAALNPGSRVKIFWHKTLFLHGLIYDYCKA